jgi:hypothetical protein
VTLVEKHDRVEARVAELMGAMNVATAELVALIADVLENETWCTAGGIKSPEHWVTWQCGVSHAHAESLVKMAHRRAELPKSFALFETGQITEDVMATVARRATPERDAEVAERLPHLLYNQVDRMLRTLPQVAPDTTPAEERPSTVQFGQRPDGRWVLHANLALDEGAVVEQALKVARSEVFFERHPDAENETRSGNVTWADGLVRAAELALRQSAVVNGREHRPGDRFQVWVHMRADELRAKLHLGEALPDWLRRFLGCDADVRATIESNDVLSEISRKFRTVDEKMRAFIEERDGGCVVPGCQQKRWCTSTTSCIGRTAVRRRPRTCVLSARCITDYTTKGSSRSEDVPVRRMACASSRARAARSPRFPGRRSPHGRSRRLGTSTRQVNGSTGSGWHGTPSAVPPSTDGRTPAGKRNIRQSALPTIRFTATVSVAPSRIDARNVPIPVERIRHHALRGQSRRHRDGSSCLRGDRA